jgi:aspartate 1-decarboxylase
MQVTVLKSKIHRATVTGADLHYEGSITIPVDLMEAADLIHHEQVHIYDVTNGHRFVTYVIPGPAGSGEIVINGAAAHQATVGDLVIIAVYCQMTEEEARRHTPALVRVDEANRII